MTCVVGLKHEDKIYIACDSFGSAGNLTVEYQNNKVLTLDIPFAKSTEVLYAGIGYTNSFRMGDILTHSFSPPEIEEDEDVRSYLVNQFIPALIECFDATYFTEIKDNVKTGGEFILGLAGRLFVVQDDFSIVEPVAPYIAIGSGEPYALGALKALELSGSPFDPEKVCLTAISVASTFSPSVGGKIKILKI